MNYGTDTRRAMEPPLRVFVGYCKSNARVIVHLNDNAKMLIEGNLLGFDEFMNLILSFLWYIQYLKRTHQSAMIIQANQLIQFHGNKYYFLT